MKSFVAAGLAVSTLTGCAAPTVEAAPSAACPTPGHMTNAESVRPLAWQGSAVVYAGDRTIPIRVRTRIAADGSVVSESWPDSQSESALRRMIIDASGGWIERGGKREPMPLEMLVHERQQYGFYKQLQQVMGRRQGLPLFSAPKVVVEGLVPTTFVLDHSLNPVEASNVVSSPEPGGKPIAQEFHLRGEIVSNCLRWPREIAIFEDGKPYFTLTIDNFDAGVVP